MLLAKGIYKNYGDLSILKGIDLQVSRAEIACIVGSSGAGKTTLLQILGTLDAADKGEIFINGQNVVQLSGEALAAFRNKHLGFIFQFHQLLPEFTALENVLIPAMIGKKPMAESTQRAKELLDFLGLAARLEHKPSQLSGGEQQRVAVARALMNKPDIILADEPSGNLDSVNAKELHDLFFRLKTEMNQTFVIVTHNRELAAMADKRFEMKDGQII
ncbi:MAG: ABC transporter ATP-binding protein [Crocinitomicaceae bacterium]|jgi:lipoprotein-releasing system ATP-binding protein|nr:ABC transporter ATP-binding protein [Crocinitomicaceae bacterium]MBK6950761.1 ABC transporter ATP-binding protein [Crocinitomicaceae bacterium]MBK9592440.1 ABC transporter ATP-binding protein [Crocinitomicaceae bacterium]